MESLKVGLIKCKKCDVFLEKDCFYSHKNNKNGYLNECKECVKKRVREREKKLRLTDPSWVKKENERLRVKYENNNYKWIVIEEFPKYSICVEGLIKNNKTNRVKKPTINSKGYLVLSLYDINSVNKKPYLHRLLADTFIEKTDKNKTQVDHIDRNPLNNSIENLRWVTPQENLDNRGVFNKTGIYYDVMNNMWCVSVLIDNSIKQLGCFTDIDESFNVLKNNLHPFLF